MALSKQTSKIFHDAIHGSMELPPLCIEIINTIQFQRLRNIKQLGLTYYVYPSASHNRFEHCLGTCHLAGRLIRHLKQQHVTLDITDSDVLCVEIAGLCHDLGHGPFSHVFQEAIKKRRDWCHEKASCKMFMHLIDSNPNIKYQLLDNQVELIKDLIIGESKTTEEKKFLFQIINNKSCGIDVDKWDYLSRDAHFLGIGLSFDYNRIIRMSRIIGGEICYSDKTLNNFYDMFYSRYQQHKKVYKHKTVLLFNRLLIEALESAETELHLFRDIDDMKKFTYITDSIFEKILKDDNLIEAQNILKDIIHRSYHCEGIVKNESKEGPEEIVCEGTFDFGNGEANPLTKILFYGKDMESKTYNLEKQKELILLPEIYQQKITYRFKKKTTSKKQDKTIKGIFKHKKNDIKKK